MRRARRKARRPAAAFSLGRHARAPRPGRRGRPSRKSIPRRRVPAGRTARPAPFTTGHPRGAGPRRRIVTQPDCRRPPVRLNLFIIPVLVIASPFLVAAEPKRMQYPPTRTESVVEKLHG